MFFKIKTNLGSKEMLIETGKMAKQADGSVTVQCGDTIVLVTAVSPDRLREGLDFMPLTIDYREKTSAAGMFPGGYIKREARPTEKEILTARLTDRPIRPLFPEGYFYEVQVMGAVLSADGQNDPDILVINGASAALTISDIPFKGPIGAVRVGLVDDTFIINPTHSELQQSTLDIVVAGTKEGISMVEGHAKELPEEKILQAIDSAYGHIQDIIKLQLDLQKKVGKPKRQSQLVTIDEDISKNMQELVEKEMDKIIRIKEKIKRQDALKTLLSESITKLKEDFPETPDSTFESAFKKIGKKKVRDSILKEGKRSDGRTADEIRSITCEIGFLPRTHGSALFTRGETQSLSITTLGTSSDGQRMEGYNGESTKTFMLHYNFPPFSVGEARPVRGPGRREIGHGLLAERALLAIMPEQVKFPYTVRIVSDILESNGSSSMATVCAGSLSLMDAGVPIKEAVSGIAMGLIQGDGKNVILSDILGSEDACGDMDFKVTGTHSGITAFQLDVKLETGISIEILKEGMEKARAGRLHILEKMNEAINTPRSNLSTYAPKVKTLQINPDKIGAVIGSGGKTIKRIIEETGANIEIEDDGKVTVSSIEDGSISKAMEIVKNITEGVDVGNIYDGTVKTIMDFGAFVEIFPGGSGLVHVSELANRFVKKAEDVVKVGDKFKVIVTKVDERGRINLSKKRLEAGSEKSKKE